MNAAVYSEWYFKWYSVLAYGCLTFWNVIACIFSERVYYLLFSSPVTHLSAGGFSWRCCRTCCINEHEWRGLLSMRAECWDATINGASQCCSCCCSWLEVLTCPTPWWPWLAYVNGMDGGMCSQNENITAAFINFHKLQTFGSGALLSRCYSFVYRALPALHIKHRSSLCFSHACIRCGTPRRYLKSHAQILFCVDNRRKRTERLRFGGFSSVCKRQNCLLYLHSCHLCGFSFYAECFLELKCEKKEKKNCLMSFFFQSTYIARGVWE